MSQILHVASPEPVAAYLPVGECAQHRIGDAWPAPVSQPSYHRSRRGHITKAWGRTAQSCAASPNTPHTKNGLRFTPKLEYVLWREYGCCRAGSGRRDGICEYRRDNLDSGRCCVWGRRFAKDMETVWQRIFSLKSGISLGFSPIQSLECGELRKQMKSDRGKPERID